MKKIVILGATGSVGKQTMDIVYANPQWFEVVGISAGKQIELVRKYLSKQFIPHVCVANKEDARMLAAEFPSVRFSYGDEGLIEIATLTAAELVVNALVGFVGLKPTMAAIAAKKDIGLANKETLVVAGEFVARAVQEAGVRLLPIDSEHSAIFQCLQGNDHKEIDLLYITASGGSFRDLTRKQLAGVTKEMALAHPNWSMGQKITIDSATMMNKGFEVIEAHYLFDQPYEKIKVLMHRQSVVHSMVQFKDNSILAQLGTADMRIPIQYALTYPQHMPMAFDNALRFDSPLAMQFEPMDQNRFPLLRIAYEVGEAKGIHPTVLNSANEVAVARFLNNEITFLDIERIIQESLAYFTNSEPSSLDTLLEVDQLVRKYASKL